MLSFCGVILGMWVVVAGQGPVQAPPGTASQPAASVVLLGRVVDASSGEPVAHARVRVRAGRSPATTSQLMVGAPGLPRLQVALQTGADGRFVVRDAPTPTLAVSVEAPGYLNVPAQAHVVAPGLKVSEVTVRLTRSASLSGRVTDDRGDPLVGVPVRTWRRTWMRGQARWTQVLTASLATTDDRGLYTVTQLPPGDYLVGTPQTQTSTPVSMQTSLFGSLAGGQTEQFVEASLGAAFSDSPLVPSGTRLGDYLLASSSGALPMPAAGGRWLVMPTTLYPGVQTVSAAQVVTITPGEQRLGVDYSIPLVPAASVTGRITASSGTVAGVGVRLRSAEDAGTADNAFDVAHTATRADGTFVMPLVPAGSYVASVVQVPRPISVAGMMAGQRPSEQAPGPTLFAQVPVVVEKDVADVVMALTGGPRVRGRIVAPAAGAVALDRVRVSVTPIDQSEILAARSALSTATVGLDGTFEAAAGPPGRYVLSVSGLPATWFARTAAWNNRNLLQQAVQLEGEDLQGIEIELSNTPASITGSVAGAGASTVVAFPEDWRAWFADGMIPLLLRQARASESGAFTLAAVPAGRYLLVALDPDALGDLQDPSVFDRLARLGTLATVADGATTTVTLRRTEGR